MRRSIFRFIGTKKQLKDKLAQMTGSNVVYLGHCELCGRMAKGDICRQCEPVFLKWSKKIATEMAAEKNHLDPTIA